MEHPIYCPDCGSQLFYLSNEKAYCIDEDCGWRTPECMCNSCKLEDCKMLKELRSWAMIYYSTFEDDTGGFDYIDKDSLMTKLDELEMNIKGGLKCQNM